LIARNVNAPAHLAPQATGNRRTRSKFETDRTNHY